MALIKSQANPANEMFTIFGNNKTAVDPRTPGMGAVVSQTKIEKLQTLQNKCHWKPIIGSCEISSYTMITRVYPTYQRG